MHRIFQLGFLVLMGCSQLPDFRVAASDPELSRSKSGEILYQGTPFSGYLVDVYENGQLMELTGFKEGLREFGSTGYHENGTVSFDRYYEKGEKEGTHRGYYENGTLKFEYEFEKGLSVGTHRTWYPDGQMASEFHYMEGKQSGAQKVWRKDGKLRSNYVIAEDGRRYGLVGIKRCKNINTEEEKITPIKASDSNEL